MNKLVKSTFILFIVTMLSKVLGFARELVLGSLYGVSLYSDAYITAYNIPIVIFSIVATALTTTFIPLYYENDKVSNNKSMAFTNNVLNITVIVGMILAIIGFIFVEPLVKIFAIGFEGYKLKLTIEFTKIMIFGGVFIGMSNIMSSFLQTKDSFTVPGLVGVPFNIIIIISMIISINTNIHVLSIGTLIAMISQFLFQLPFANKKGYKYIAICNVKDEYIKKMVWLIAPVLIGVSVNQINTMVDRTIASTLIEGSISALNYANKLNGFVTGLFIVTLSAVIYPMLSKLSIDKNNKVFNDVIVKIVNIVILLIIPISIGAIVLSTPVVRLLFERGVFDSKATYMTSVALIFYSIGMVGYGLRDILGKVFYSLQDTRTPMVNGVITMIMNIVFNIALVKVMGYPGLALGTSLASLFGVIIMFISLKNKIGHFGEGKIINTTVKCLISSIIMGLVVIVTYKFLHGLFGTGFMSEVISLLGSVGIGVVIYSVLLVILKVEEVNVIVDIIRKKLRLDDAITKA